jgi:hypothetical protein
MTPCRNLLLKNTVTILFVLTALVSLPYLSSSYFPNQYVMAAHSSSLQHKTTGESGIQICCSWGNKLPMGY